MNSPHAGCSPLAAGMRTDDALNLIATALTFIFFPLSMTEFAELAAVFFGNPVLPASHGAPLSLGNRIAATKETDVRKSSGDDSVETSFAESMFTAALLECPSPPILCVGEQSRTMRGRPSQRRPRRVHNS